MSKEFRQQKEEVRDKLRSEDKRLSEINRVSADKIKREHSLQRQRLRRYKSTRGWTQEFKEQRARANHE